MRTAASVERGGSLPDTSAATEFLRTTGSKQPTDTPETNTMNTRLLHGTALKLTLGVVLSAMLASSSLAQTINLPPPGLQPGEPYRVLFATDSGRDATSSHIADYDAVVIADTSAVPELVALNTTFQAVASTPTVHARDHTNTDPTPPGSTGVPIYNVAGVRLADDYDHLWSGGWLHAPVGYTASGAAATVATWTGTGVLGTADPGKELGCGGQMAGGGSPTSNAYTWIWAYQIPVTSNKQLYGISDVVSVPWADGIHLDVEGTVSAATITARVVGSAVFQSDASMGALSLTSGGAPATDIWVDVNGQGGAVNPFRVMAPADGSSIWWLTLSSGDYSNFQLDSSNPITSSTTVVHGSITDLQALDGVATFMSLTSGGGTVSSVDVHLHYNVVPDPTYLIIDVNGTPSSATIRASVVGSSTFQSGPGGVLNFWLPPNTQDIYVGLEGPLGGANPTFIRAPASANDLNAVHISSGNLSSFQLDSSNPITSSTTVAWGSITDLAVLDGVTSYMTVTLGSGPDIDVVLNYNVVPDPVAFCFGDPGSGTPCPCSNDNDGSVPGSGCANGAFASGAKLTSSGVASMSADTLVLATTGLEPSNSGLYFQANNDLSPGNVWGDGLQCAGGDLRRLGVRFSDATGYSDTSGYPHTISAKAGNITPGDTKYYQCWYRNPLNSPCGSDFNASNGYAVTWLP
jgi:hypothetical protein